MDEFIEKVKVISVKDGDVLALKTSLYLNSDIKSLIREDISKYFPSNEIIILDRGMDLDIYRCDNE